MKTYYKVLLSVVLNDLVRGQPCKSKGYKIIIIVLTLLYEFVREKKYTLIYVIKYSYIFLHFNDPVSHTRKCKNSL